MAAPAHRSETHSYIKQEPGPQYGSGASMKQRNVAVKQDTQRQYNQEKTDMPFTNNYSANVSHVTNESHSFGFPECNFGVPETKTTNPGDLRILSRNVPFVCTECDFMSEDIGTLEMHMLTTINHRGQPEFRCPLCVFLYKTESRMHFVTHMESHKGCSAFACSECGYLTSIEINFINHVWNHQVTDRSIICYLYDLTSDNSGGTIQYKLVEDINVPFRKTDMPFSCSECGIVAKDLMSIKRHMAVHNGERQLEPACPSDIVAVKQEDSLSVSDRSDIIESPSPPFNSSSTNVNNPPSDSPKRSNSSEIKEKPNRAVPFICIECDFINEDIDALDTHMLHSQNHSGRTEFRCPLCVFMVKADTKSEFISHMVQHKGKCVYICSTCGYLTSIEPNFTNHFLSHGTIIQPIPCDIYELTIETKGNTTIYALVHMMTFSFCKEQKPFSCSQCNYLFKSILTLMQHMILHTKVESFDCSLCNVTCKTKDLLSQHMLSHNQENKRKKLSESACRYGCKYKCHHQNQSGILQPVNSIGQPSEDQTNRAVSHVGRYSVNSVIPKTTNSQVNISKAPKQSTSPVPSTASLSYSNNLKHLPSKTVENVPVQHIQISNKPMTSIPIQQVSLANKSGNEVQVHLIQNNPNETKVNDTDRLARYLPFVCTNCEFISEKIDDLETHMLVTQGHADKREFRCPLCVFMFTTDTKESFLLHMSHHRDKSVYTCTACGYLTSIEHYFIAHLVNHRDGLQTIWCQVFDLALETSQYTTKYKFVNKMKLPFNKNQNVFSCSECESTSLSIVAIEQHMPIHKR